MDPKSSFNFEDIRIPKLDVVIRCLRQIPQYAALSNIYLAQVDVTTLIPLARYVVKERLAFVKSFTSTMIEAGVEPYKPIYLKQSPMQWRLVMPPVVEKHDNQWVVFDGLHRFWLARQKGITHPWALCIDSPPLQLPSKPRDWDQVVLTETQYPVSENLADMDESLVRPLSRMFKSSLTLFNQIDVEI